MKSTPIGEFLTENFNSQPMTLVSKNITVSLDITPKRPSGYVEPTVSFSEEITIAPAPILLISAAGAMGKTFTSMAIAELLGCPRLDLSHLTVGQDTHSGVLNRALKGSSFAEFMGQLESGKTCLVIDSLDEAPLRSGERAFFAFMESLAEEAKSFDTYAHQFVLLGRPQTIELFRDLCISLDTPTHHITLDSLSLESSLQLIANELSKSSSTRLHETHPTPAREYWTNYLFDLGSTLLQKDDFASNDWGEVADFLGYPPVICAIAPTLDETNFLQSSQNLKKSLPAIGSRSIVLTRIIEDLLARETKKVQRQLSEVFKEELAMHSVRALYNYEEQIARVLSHLGILAPDTLPASLPEDLRSRYEECIEAFVADHPFLNGQSKPKPRNVVFSDHLRAIVNSQTGFISSATSKPVQSEALLPIGPFYAYFMHDLLAKMAVQNEALDLPGLPTEDFVRDVISSWNCGVQNDWSPSFQYDHREGSVPVLDLHMEKKRLDTFETTDEAKLGSSLSFAIRNPAGLLELASPVSNVTLFTDHGVFISPSGGSITLGPNASLISRTIQTSHVDEIILRSSSSATSETSDFAALIFSQEFNIPGDYKIHRSGSELATVIVPNLDQRWKAYQPKIRPIDGLDRSKVVEAVTYIRRILMSFRSTNGALALHIDKFNRHVIGRNELMLTVSEAMKKAELIAVRDGLVVINQAELSRLEINYATYNSPNWTEKLSAALATCLNRDPNLVASLSASR